MRFSDSPMHVPAGRLARAVATDGAWSAGRKIATMAALAAVSWGAVGGLAYAAFAVADLAERSDALRLILML